MKLKIYNILAIIIGFFFNLLCSTFQKVRQTFPDMPVAKQIIVWAAIITMTLLIVFIVKWGFF